MNIKTIIPGCAAVLLAGALLAGCASLVSDQEPGGDDKIQIITTGFAEYDWVRNIIGETDDAELTLLGDGTDMHSFQPSVDDVIKISECDIFIYPGGESSEWAEDVLRDASNKEMTVINLIDVLGDKAKEEETVEGMQESDEDDEAEYDEHVWLSLVNAESICGEIAGALSELDPANADIYLGNANKYEERLKTLDAEYRQVADSAKIKTLLFGDRFPFLYMTKDYGLDYYAAFAGCSADTEASFDTISFLSEKVDELGLGSVLKIEDSDGRIAETIVANTAKGDQKILTLDSMQNVTKADIEGGKTYIGVMEENLEVLREALEGS